MPQIPACPPPDQLRKFALGDIPETDAQTLEQHLETCERCWATLIAESGGDTLVDAVRNAQAQPAADDLVEAMVARIEGLRQSASSVSRSSLAESAIGEQRGEATQAFETPPVDGRRDTPTTGAELSSAASAADDIDFLAPPKAPGELGRLGGYRILQVLGSGGMGVVFVAEDPQLQRRVALKVMRPALAASKTARQRFLREARLAASIEHDHLVHIYQVGEDRGMPFLAMQLLRGESLEDRLRRPEPVPIAEVIRIGREIAEGLTAAHQQDLIHRDIKPANVFLSVIRGPSSVPSERPANAPATHHGQRTADYRVKILDFGLARAVEDDAHITGSGVIAGTPAYMAPEQARAEPVDARTDLFSLGCVLYRMLAGRPPFRGTSTTAVLMSLATEQPTAPIDVNPVTPPDLSDLVMRLLAKKPAERPASARQVADQLARLAHQVEGARPATSPAASGERQGVSATGDKPADAPTDTNTQPAPADGTRYSVRGAQYSVPAEPAPRRRRWLIAAALLLALIGAGWYLAQVIIRVPTEHGELIIEVEDENLIAEVGKHKVVFRDAKTMQKTFELAAGPGKVIFRDALTGHELFAKEFTLKHGQQTRVSATLADVRAARARGAAELGANAPRFTNTLGMEFALVPKGKAWLGGGGGKPGDKEVDFKEDFYLGVYEVTQEDWEKVMEKNPSHFSRQGKGAITVKDIADASLRRFPVESVSWDECQLFLAKLNETTKASGWIYRLPSREEWEYACRGGPMTNRSDSAFDYYFERPKRELTSEDANFKGSNLQRPRDVGCYKPNALGLHDMHGNVAEWCADSWPNDASMKLVVSGGWINVDRDCTPIYRYASKRADRYAHVGLRVARVRVSSAMPQPSLAAAPFDEKQAKAHQEEWAKHLGRKVVEDNSLGMKMMLIPPGKFTMGNADTAEKVGKDFAGTDNERPAHEVEIMRPFVLSVAEVTQEQFEKIMDRNPSAFSPKGFKQKDVVGIDTKKLPVEMVTWFDAVEFCNKLSANEGLPPYYELKYPVRTMEGVITMADVKELGSSGYRLPTEAEWEYACRAGTTTPFSFKFDYGTLGQFGWFGYDSKRTHEVGTRKPNPFGLHDMHGNVHEWCQDCSGAYTADPVRNPMGPATGTERISRGGAYNFLVQYGRSAWRGRAAPGARYDNTGFRVARTVPGAVVPPADPDRRAAEWVLLDRGPRHRSNLHLLVDGKSVRLTTGDKVPDGPFVVQQISISGLGKADSAVAVEHLTKLGSTDLRIYHSPGIGDEELESLARHPSFQDLKILVMNTVGVTERGLPHIANFAKLETLDLGLAPISAKEFALLRGLPLKSLTISISKTVNDDAIAVVAGFPALKRLELADVAITDRALDHLAKSKSLESLDFRNYLKGMTFTPGARKKLAEALPHCKILWDGADLDPDRRAAEWALSIAGSISIKENGKEREVKAVGDLPGGAFELTFVDLSNNPMVDDASLARFKDCQNLTQLTLSGVKVGDAGMAHLKNCKNLTVLTLKYTQVSDVGLAELRDCKKLTGLGLGYTRVSDRGLAQLKEYKDLWGIDLSHTTVSDAGLPHLKDCKNLTNLLLRGTSVSNAGLAHLKDHKSWKQVVLDHTKVTDAGLAYLQDATNLRELDLNNTQVGDAGLAYLKDCRELTHLSLANTQVTDAGLAHLSGCKNMFDLDLRNTQASAAGLAHFKDSKNLHTLRLDGARVSDADLERLAGFAMLANLSIKKTQVTQVGVKKLAAALPACRIEWDGDVGAPKTPAEPQGKPGPSSSSNAPPPASLCTLFADPTIASLPPLAATNSRLNILLQIIPSSIILD